MHPRDRDYVPLVSDNQSSNASSLSEPSLGASRPVKRSFSIAGHRTSISLEAAFWS